MKDIFQVSLLNRLLVLVFCLMGQQVLAEGGGTAEKRQQSSPHKPLDIVFCIDLSGSTNGLINDLRDNLWLMINLAQRMDPRPELRIGVVGFSRPSFGRENAYVKILSPLTRNFDALAAELYKLRPSIEKGDQIVSAALRTCIYDMKWSDREDAVKMVYLVGNGMVTANGYEYVRYCEEARERNIPIHALYVMKSANWFKELPGYRRIAGLTNGMQTEITVNKTDDVKVWSSVTENLEPLNRRYNATYLWSGNDSSYCRKALFASDSGAFFANTDVFLNRLYYKSGEHFAANFAACDVVSNNALLFADTNPEFSSAYQQRVRELFSIREQYREELHARFTDADLIKTEQAYISGQLPDNNILHRCVMNILYRAWGMR
ncbi:MAG: VWA domain-containing protein [Bacteroidia bacterium]|nr:VWA domain-containing protein [Bacteroidia bacterium]